MLELEELIINEDAALDLERDGLADLPKNSSKLSTLEELYLNGHKLKSTPPSLMLMRRSKLIDLHENPIDPLIPLDLQQRGALIRL